MFYIFYIFTFSTLDEATALSYLNKFLITVNRVATHARPRARRPRAPAESEAYKRGRIKRGCSQKPDLQMGGKTGPRHIQNTGRVP